MAVKEKSKPHLRAMLAMSADMPWYTENQEYVCALENLINILDDEAAQGVDEVAFLAELEGFANGLAWANAIISELTPGTDIVDLARIRKLIADLKGVRGGDHHVE